MRLTALIPTFAFLSVGNSYLGISAIYLLPWMDVCESISLMNFFLLIHAYLADANVDDIHAPLDSIRNDPASFSAVVWNSPTQERFIPKTGAMTVRAPTASVFLDRFLALNVADARVEGPPWRISVYRGWYVSLFRAHPPVVACSVRLQVDGA